tara:strand:- start:951 stop:1247 length:297 start_codon:yes stop_codon:yes gene_type:complete
MTIAQMLKHPELMGIDQDIDIMDLDTEIVDNGWNWGVPRLVSYRENTDDGEDCIGFNPDRGVLQTPDSGDAVDILGDVDDYTDYALTVQQNRMFLDCR